MIIRYKIYNMQIYKVKQLYKYTVLHYEENRTPNSKATV